MMKADQPAFVTKRWITIALINFCLVALAGVTMRYKIRFALPFVDQQYLMYGHSNFAFTGWVAIALMTLMVRYLIRSNLQTNYTKYNRLLTAYLIVTYGMFAAFIAQGYDFWSNTFSIISILLSYLFVYFYWKDLNKVEDISTTKSWFKAALGLWAFSSLGAFSLAYLLANHVMIQDLYFAALYFFLHFQYNGWFLFVCFGAFFAYMHRQGLHEIEPESSRLFWILVITVVPSFFLSILWLNLPSYLHYTAVASGVIQLIILIYFIRILNLVRKRKDIAFGGSTALLWTLASIAFILKIVLQFLSIIPFLSHLAFGFRPVIIGYLHLSFVGIISFFVLGYINEFIHRFRGRVSGIGAVIFVVGFIIQELILMLQGLEALNVQPVKAANLILFFCAILMAAGLIWIVTGIIRANDTEYQIAADTKK
ncbi:MAG: hypothetical protein J0H55_12080 [Chitinophagaceae bacterium]|nr:hypothetical protein [Chitinophagaceae bacterium]